MPEGAVVHYVLAKWASAGSGGLLELGPTMVHRLWAVVEKAEETGTDAARLEAYEQLRQMISWLRLPLVDEGTSRVLIPKSAGPRRGHDRVTGHRVERTGPGHILGR